MRTAVVFFYESNRDAALAAAKGLCKGIEAQGHTCDIIDGNTDVQTKLSAYQYICIGHQFSRLLTGRVSARAQEFLSQAGLIGGKRCFAFIMKKGFAAQKTLKRFMDLLESEGMFVQFSDQLQSPEEAELIGKNLQIERP
ncbi:hypothetical protein [Spirochaeta africana]|uniref:Flavodoxin-like domain-containing protein n=1 Tax=Spirochaeta africana (strain ATCC 700263 / DSM 8902 / Z-7692) TaxID=889378 RepID=H9UJJ4_SPIAZ|nr:hypothetical protein [Spirochaeta africana]AFG37687.1 hypothetical protein Spiaf_1629 [Spirochaeta africana DSM 8902]